MRQENTILKMSRNLGIYKTFLVLVLVQLQSAVYWGTVSSTLMCSAGGTDSIWPLTGDVKGIEKMIVNYCVLPDIFH